MVRGMQESGFTEAKGWTNFKKETVINSIKIYKEVK